MKKLLALSFCGLLLAGCGDSIPSECETTLKEYDKFITQMEQQSQLPEQVKAQFKDGRKSLAESLKTLSKNDAINACKAANQSFEQLKQMMPQQ